MSKYKEEDEILEKINNNLKTIKENALNSPYFLDNNNIKPDYDSIAYFSKSTLERMADWGNQLELIRKHHPEVAEAYDNMVTAKKHFYRLINEMLEGVE